MKIKHSSKLALNASRGQRKANKAHRRRRENWMPSFARFSYMRDHPMIPSIHH